MYPEMSLVFLTVLAGVGQGMFILLVILDALFLKSGEVTPHFLMVAGITSLIFPLIGMAASFFHLGNPMRGWKAIFKWKQSWLSREVIFLPAFVGFQLLYLLLLYSGAPGLYRLFAGFLGIVAAMGLYISSAMLYAAIRFIKEWATALTPINFILFGLTSGTAVTTAAAHYSMPGMAIGYLLSYLVAFLCAFSLVMKGLAFQYNATVYSDIGVKNALGMNNPHIRLMDTGAAYAHFNTKEYFLPMTQRQNGIQQTLVLGISFFLPLLMALYAAYYPALKQGGLFSTAALLIILGLILERRLFFIQGNHIQNLYYGNYRRNEVQNPAASKAKPGTPQPK